MAPLEAVLRLGNQRKVEGADMRKIERRTFIKNAAAAAGVGVCAAIPAASMPAAIVVSIRFMSSPPVASVLP